MAPKRIRPLSDDEGGLTKRFQSAWPRREQRVVLLLSGGGDSVALFRLLLAVGQPFSSLYFHHHPRAYSLDPCQRRKKPSFAQASEEYCRSLCQAHGIELEIEPIEPESLARKANLSWEAAARQLRYFYLADKQAIYLTAHTADDQAETVLMRLLDGSGLAGLSGIKALRADGVERPLLGFRRQELRAYLKSLDQEWMEDPTNLDGNDRARIRNRLLSGLESFRPHLVSTLCATASRLAEDEEALTKLATSWLATNSLGESNDHLPIEPLKKLSKAIRYRVLRQLWRQSCFWEGRPLASLFQECERLITKGADNKHVVLGQKVHLRRLGGYLWLEPVLPECAWSLSLASSDPLSLQGQGWHITKKRPAADSQAHVINLPARVFLANQEYKLRSRRAGDHFQGVSIKSLLAATKQPPWVRDRWPLLVNKNEIVAVPGISKEPQTGEGPDFWLLFYPHRLRWGQEGEKRTL